VNGFRNCDDCSEAIAVDELHDVWLHGKSVLVCDTCLSQYSACLGCWEFSRVDEMQDGRCSACQKTMRGDTNSGDHA